MKCGVSIEQVKKVYEAITAGGTTIEQALEETYVADEKVSGIFAANGEQIQSEVLADQILADEYGFFRRKRGTEGKI